MSLALAVAPALSRLPRGVADQLVANLLFRRLYVDGPTRSVGARVGGACFDLDLADWPQAQATMLRRYDPETVAFVVEHLPERGIYIEGGGHVGLIALQVAVARPDAEVHVFEPHPLRFAQLEQNVALNGARVTVNRCGLSDSKGELRFDSNSHQISESGDIRVPVVRLDDYAEKVDVLKLDIEGHELAALQGAHGLFESDRVCAVTLEVTHSEGPPARLLADHGLSKVEMPDLRPALVRRLRPSESANAAYVARKTQSGADMPDGASGSQL